MPDRDFYKDYCDIWCLERGSCSFTEINCFPHRRCVLHCNGAGSCNRTILKGFDGIRLRVMSIQ